MSQRLSAVTGMAWVFVAIVLGSGVIGGVARGLGNRPDWPSWQRDTQHVWAHHATPHDTRMFGYLPTTTFALWPFTVVLPHPWGLFGFVGVNLLAAVGSIWMVGRWWMPAGLSPAAIVWPMLLVSANLQHVLQANQLTLWTLFLCVAGLTLVHRGRDLTGGVVLGLAVLIKTLPVLLVGYLLCRRRWAAVAGVGVGVVLFDVVPSVAFFGPRGALREHTLWLQRAAGLSNARQIADPLRTGGHFHKSNFSYSAVLARWLRGVPSARR